MATDSAVLLTNLGTPDALDRAAVKRFLGEFLSDPLVVRLPRLFWLPLLHGVILPIRSGKTLAAYRRIWGDEGSPLLHFSTLQRDALRRKLGKDQRVEIAMRYGNPSFPEVLEALRDGGIERLLVLPLYPQYSVTTTATPPDTITTSNLPAPRRSGMGCPSTPWNGTAGSTGGAPPTTSRGSSSTPRSRGRCSRSTCAGRPDRRSR